jgi:hypothetical protein
MVEKRRAKEAQQIMTGIYSYPDKIAITNLLRRGFLTQLKGGYKR